MGGSARRHAATPTRRHADTPTRRHADTPTRRHADTPTRRHAGATADAPTRRHADTPTRFRGGLTDFVESGSITNARPRINSSSMKKSLRLPSISPGCTLGLFALAMSLLTQIAPAEPSASPTEERDGQHDFDFNIGVWHTHIRRILDPLSGSTHSIDLDGVVTVRKVWGGRAELEEIEADGPKGHWEGLTLFLYNPKSHQWSQSFINSKIGELGPSSVGAFKDDRVELVSQDTVNGRSILVRAVWSDIKPDSHHYEESYSDDGGKTWRPSFNANLTREKQTSDPDDMPANLDAAHLSDRQTDLDFHFGAWKVHSSRLLHPLTGSTTWSELAGESMVRKVWGGRACLAEYQAEGPAGKVEILALHWYNPVAHQWNVDFATPGVGTLGVPGVGEFKNGRGDFYDQETINGRTVLVRFSIWSITADTAQSEQAFSDDGGKTWEVNWINKFTRIKSPTS